MSEQSGDGTNRRGVLKCMAWAGTGALWTVGGGVLGSTLLGEAQARPATGFSFVQVSPTMTILLIPSHCQPLVGF